MSKATQRREKKLAQYLRNLAVSNPARFIHEWDTMLRCWTLEAIRRGQLLRQEPASGDTASPQLPVFGVLKKAERLLVLCGPEASNWWVPGRENCSITIAASHSPWLLIPTCIT